MRALLRVGAEEAGDACAAMALAAACSPRREALPGLPPFLGDALASLGSAETPAAAAREHAVLLSLSGLAAAADAAAATALPTPRPAPPFLRIAWSSH